MTLGQSTPGVRGLPVAHAGIFRTTFLHIFNTILTGTIYQSYKYNGYYVPNRMFDNPSPDEFAEEIESLIDDKKLDELHNGDEE